MSADFDIPNWLTLAVEVPIGLFIAWYLYKLQNKTDDLHRSLLNEISTTTKRTDSVTQKKAQTEQQKKVEQCERIIEPLEFIKTKEVEFIEYIKTSALDDTFKEMLRFTFIPNLGSNITTWRINEIRDACRMLEGSISDYSLLLDMRRYSEMLMLPSEMILTSNMPQNEREREKLLNLLERQVKKIQDFIDRFSKEKDSS